MQLKINTYFCHVLFLVCSIGLLTYSHIILKLPCFTVYFCSCFPFHGSFCRVAASCYTEPWAQLGPADPQVPSQNRLRRARRRGWRPPGRRHRAGLLVSRCRRHNLLEHLIYIDVLKISINNHIYIQLLSFCKILQVQSWTIAWTRGKKQPFVLALHQFRCPVFAKRMQLVVEESWALVVDAVRSGHGGVLEWQQGTLVRRCPGASEGRRTFHGLRGSFTARALRARSCKTGWTGCCTKQLWTSLQRSDQDTDRGRIWEAAGLW